jgi:voltage-gated potassium channel
VFRVEHSLPDTTFRTRGDALWWGLVTVTTIGYGDIYPKTTEGRVLAGMLMLFGIGVVASMTALIAEYYIRKPRTPSHGHPEQLQADLSVLREYLERIEQDVRELRAENDRLRGGR